MKTIERISNLQIVSIFIVVFLLRGLHGSGLHRHLDLVLGACQQLDGAALAEAGPVHLEEDGPLVGLDAERDGDVDDGRDAVHVHPAVGFSLPAGGVGWCWSGAPEEEVEEGKGEDAEDAAVLRRDRRQAVMRSTSAFCLSK